MWIVKNVLRGSIQIEDLKVKIPAKDYFDLDKIGRERAEGSRQLKLAMEEGYLQNVKKQDPGTNETVLVKEETRSEIKSRIEELRQVILKSPDKDTVLKALQELRSVLAGSKDVEQIRADFDDLKKLIQTMDGDGGWLKKEFETLRKTFFDKEKDEKAVMKREVLEL
ncbi:MAG: alpha-helical pore-forming toxin family protein, partial [Planctomycetes bacterium]|nr:alpha-helical pore-forming toxin family protein [Planctomycetota bacterium]